MYFFIFYNIFLCYIIFKFLYKFWYIFFIHIILIYFLFFYLYLSFFLYILIIFCIIYLICIRVSSKVSYLRSQYSIEFRFHPLIIIKKKKKKKQTEHKSLLKHPSWTAEIRAVVGETGPPLPWAELSWDPNHPFPISLKLQCFSLSPPTHFCLF